MSKLVTIYGGSGFIGRYIVQRLAHQGWRIRVAVRRPNEALFVKTYGAVGQVEPVFCNIRDDASVRSVMQGADAVVNCVGILVETGKNSFDAIHNQGAGRIARIAASEGVSTLVHLSAIGASENALSDYARSKAAGEAAVLANFPSAHILRPAVVFGPEDQFFNKFARMCRFSPVLPIVGGETRMQPVYVDDVAQAAAMAVERQALADVYELGGPEVYTLRELIGEMLEITQRRRLVLDLPFWVGSVMGRALDMAQTVSLGLFTNTILTADQVKSLRRDTVVSAGMPGFAELGIDPVTVESVLPDYLWVYRRDGQYAAIKASARNLKV